MKLVSLQNKTQCLAYVLAFLVGLATAVPESPSHHATPIVRATAEKLGAEVASKGANGQGGAVFDCKESDTECSKDKQEYEAISVLHRLIDDDQNGNVDQSESDEFLRDELQYTDGFERHSLFHNNDKLISVDDLWKAWKFSEVYNWTVDDVVEWLQKEVDLPQYSSIFQEKVVSGPFLPRLASSSQFVVSLGIKNPVHKQKLSLKAMDTVLFGAPRKRHNYVKDVVLVASLIFAIGGCWFAYLHHRYSQEQVRKMMKDLESLQKAEEALLDVQRKLEDAENTQVSSLSATSFQDSGVGEKVMGLSSSGGDGTRQIEEELAATILALHQAENRLEQHWSAPAELQAWLQLTHELEQIHYTAKRQAAERQFQAARDSCDKIKKRNKAFLGSFRMAHSNSLDEIDQRILDARLALEEVKQDLQERLLRWHTIEKLCGFPIITNPGLNTLHQLLHGSSLGGSNTARLPASVVGPVSVDEADEDLPPAGYTPVSNATNPRSFLRQRTGTGSTGSLSHLPRMAPYAGSTQSSSHATLASAYQDSRELDSPSSSSGVASPSSGIASPVTFHLGDQVQHPQERIVTMAHGFGLPSSVRAASIANGLSTHPYLASSIPDGGRMVTSEAAYSTSPRFPVAAQHSQGPGSTASVTHSKSMNFTDSEDNLSQTTMDSLPRSHSSAAIREGILVNSDHNFVNNSNRSENSGSTLALGGVKKPSKKKKLLNMFKKTPKHKPV